MKGQVRAATLGLRIWFTESELAKGNCTVVETVTTASSKHPKQEWTTQPPIQWIMSAFSPGVKLPCYEAEHLVLSSAEVKNGLSYTFIPLCVYMAYIGTLPHNFQARVLLIRNATLVTLIEV